MDADHPFALRLLVDQHRLRIVARAASHPVALRRYLVDERNVDREAGLYWRRATDG